METPEKLKSEILSKVVDYYQAVHATKKFEPGKTRVQFAGRVFDDHEMRLAIDSCLDFYLTLGEYKDQFESVLKKYTGAFRASISSSGSAANFTAVTSFKSPYLPNPLKDGDEVLTPAVTFPTTLNPILFNNLMPVFVDCEVGTYNVNVDLLEKAISPKTRAMVLPHTLGNLLQMDRIVALCKEHKLFLMEDCCDALGSTYDGKMAGTFGEVSTLSCYPAHHITMGEGGAVMTMSPLWSKIVRSIRDWGKDCVCEKNAPYNGVCNQRLQYKIPGLEEPYDHRYVYTNIGFNNKPTDIQAAIGVAQMKKLPQFVEARKRNFKKLYTALKQWEQYLVLPRWEQKADPSWFAFPLTVRGSEFKRHELIDFLERESNIETRLLFAGNILRQPGYSDIKHRLGSTLENSDTVMERSFFVGVYPGLTDEMIDYMIDRFSAFFKSKNLK